MRYAARRDLNESELVTFARQLGAWLVKLDQPADWLLGWRGSWNLVEIKDPAKRGRADEFTGPQREFHQEAAERGLTVIVWRTDADVLATLRAAVSA